MSPKKSKANEEEEDRKNYSKGKTESRVQNSLR